MEQKSREILSAPSTTGGEIRRRRYYGIARVRR